MRALTTPTRSRQGRGAHAQALKSGDMPMHSGDRHIEEPPFPPSSSNQWRWGVSPDIYSEVSRCEAGQRFVWARARRGVVGLFGGAPNGTAPVRQSRREAVSGGAMASSRPVSNRRGKSISDRSWVANTSVRRSTCETVRARIRTSSPRLQWSTYQASSCRRSSNREACRPFTAAQPVIPGRISWRRPSSRL